MQTFMPMINYRASLEALDDLRLNKQVLECSTMIDVIMDESKGYQDHPAVRMWRDNVLSLCNYGAIAAQAWSERRSTALDRQAWFAQRAKAIRDDSPKDWVADMALYPAWVGELWVHRSHRSNLIRKDPLYYDEWPGTPVDMPYIWPMCTSRDGYEMFVSEADYKRLKTGERALPRDLLIEDVGSLRKVVEVVSVGVQEVH